MPKGGVTGGRATSGRCGIGGNWGGRHRGVVGLGMAAAVVACIFCRVAIMLSRLVAWCSFAVDIMFCKSELC
jgi:hypothetical protein